jgi:hypothetical protein
MSLEFHRAVARSAVKVTDIAKLDNLKALGNAIHLYVPRVFIRRWNSCDIGTHHTPVPEQFPIIRGRWPECWDIWDRDTRCWDTPLVEPRWARAWCAEILIGRSTGWLAASVIATEVLSGLSALDRPLWLCRLLLSGFFALNQQQHFLLAPRQICGASCLLRGRNGRDQWNGADPSAPA